MKYLKFSPIILALAFLLYYYFGVYQPPKQVSPQGEQSGQLASTEQEQWETKSDNQSPVTVKATPVELGKDFQTWKFQIIFDTHSGSLDDDPLQIAVLADDKGKVYRPIAWDGPGSGGHHREGILIFNPVAPSPEYVELKVRNVGGVSERLFRWNLE